jgi:hypothetical protein
MVVSPSTARGERVVRLLAALYLGYGRRRAVAAIGLALLAPLLAALLARAELERAAVGLLATLLGELTLRARYRPEPGAPFIVAAGTVASATGLAVAGLALGASAHSAGLAAGLVLLGLVLSTLLPAVPFLWTRAWERRQPEPRALVRPIRELLAALRRRRPRAIAALRPESALDPFPAEASLGAVLDSLERLRGPGLTRIAGECAAARSSLESGTIAEGALQELADSLAAHLRSASGDLEPGEPGARGGRALALIEAYHRHVSPIAGHDCRYWPSCSRYAARAIAELGTLRGGRAALLRILRCTPSASGGYDPPPGRAQRARAV